jgi:Low affinity iron permease
MTLMRHCSLYTPGCTVVMPGRRRERTLGRWFARLTTLRSGWHPLRNRFSLVLVILNTQNRDIKAMHLKLGELIQYVQAADNALIRVEDETDVEWKR